MIIKRLFDLLISGLFLLALLPIFLPLCVFVRLFMGSPIFFVQERAGHKGKVFKIFKFRTMTEKRDEKGELLPDDLRLNSFGRFLRSTSLDELPQLLNVLRGDLSIVGPRPLLVEYLPLYSEEQNRRHDVLPGITGWAQVKGRNSISWEEKFKLDVWYVDNQSFWLDLKIIYLTILVVFNRSGVNSAEEKIMPKFKGSSN